MFDREAEQIVDNLLLDLAQEPPPHISYHYTTDVGLQGILESGKLWLTDIFALNDPSELRHGYKLAIDILDEQAKSGPDEYLGFAEVFKTVLNEKFKEIAHYFICSFSEHGDNLGQWRAYADDGRGYVLGFDTTVLEKQFLAAATSSGGVFRVTYNDEALKEIYRPIIEKWLPLTLLPRDKNLSQNVLKMYKVNLFILLTKYVFYVSSFFKHVAYKDETEYRFLESQSADTLLVPQYRARHYSLIKYKEFDWKSAGLDVLKKIVIGPAADFEKSKRFAKDCLREAGIDLADDAITQSQIPYKPA